MISNIFGAILNLVLAVVVVVEVFIPTVQNANTTGFSSAELSLYGLITLGAIAGLVYNTLAAFGVL